MKYESVDQIEKAIAEVIKNETGAEVEVTIRTKIMIYTEDLDKLEAVKAFMARTEHALERESFYEAEEDFPAGVTLTYSQ